MAKQEIKKIKTVTPTLEREMNGHQTQTSEDSPLSDFLSTERYYPAVQAIFKHLTKPAMYNSRLVCRSWNTTVSNVMREKYPKEIRFDIGKSDAYAEMKTATKIMKTAGSFPMLHCNIVSSIAFNEVCQIAVNGQQELVDFFKVCSTHIRKLSVDCTLISRWTNADVTRDDYNYTQLETLTINPGKEFLNGQFIIDYDSSEILKWFPSIVLREHDYSNYVEEYVDVNSFVLMDMVRVELQAPFKNLTTLKVEVEFKHQCRWLSGVLDNLTLTILHLTLSIGLSNAEFNDLFKVQRKTLRFLRLDVAENGVVKEPLTFPIMKKLEGLRIHLIQLGEAENIQKSEIFKAISYSEQLPVVTFVELLCNPFSIVSTFFSPSMRLSSTVRDLLIFVFPNDIRSNCELYTFMLNLAHWFPCLETLSLGTNIYWQDALNTLKMIELPIVKPIIHFMMVKHSTKPCIACTLHECRDKDNYKSKAYPIYDAIIEQLNELKMSLHSVHFSCHVGSKAPRPYTVVFKNDAGVFKVGILIPRPGPDRKACKTTR